MAGADSIAISERLALYHALEATWATAVTADDAGTWWMLREESQATPVLDQAKNAPPPNGSGKDYPEYDYFTAGAKQMRALSTTHPLTNVSLRDLFGIFCQNSRDSTTHWMDPETAATISMHATVMTKTEANSENDSVLKGISCFPTQLALTIPAEGESKIAATWVGCNASIGTSQSVANATLDTGDALLGHDCQLDIDGTERDGMTSASMTFTNGATLLAARDPDTRLSLGGVLGRQNVTGNITVVDLAVGAGTSDAYKTLQAAWVADADTAASEIVLHFTWTSVDIAFPCVLTNRSDPQDMGGAVGYTFDFTYAGGDATTPVWEVTVPNLDSSPYYSA